MNCALWPWTLWGLSAETARCPNNSPPPSHSAPEGGRRGGRVPPTTAKTAVSPRQRDFKTQPLKSPSRLPLADQMTAQMCA
jgi:hypothetical protein